MDVKKAMYINLRSVCGLVTATSSVHRLDCQYLKCSVCFYCANIKYKILYTRSPAYVRTKRIFYFCSATRIHRDTVPDYRYIKTTAILSICERPAERQYKLYGQKLFVFYEIFCLYYVCFRLRKHTCCSTHFVSRSMNTIMLFIG